MKKLYTLILSILIFILFAVPAVYGETVNLKIGAVRAGGQQYFVELLKQAVTAQGHDLNMEVFNKLPQKRILYMLKHGALSTAWFLRKKEKDDKFAFVNVGITNGLIGHRILFIGKGRQQEYDTVKTLEDFRNLGKVGAFGRSWYDVDVWKHNNLTYIERDGAWRNKIYRQIGAGNRGVDYFSRGFFEIAGEYKEHGKHVDIEQRLVLIYDRDFVYYLSKPAEKYKALLEKALINARETGLMDKLMKQNLSESFDTIDLSKRIKIHLKNPPAK